MKPLRMKTREMCMTMGEKMSLRDMKMEHKVEHAEDQMQELISMWL